jgi:hypothetical protein
MCFKREHVCVFTGGGRVGETVYAREWVYVAHPMVASLDTFDRCLQGRASHVATNIFFAEIAIAIHHLLHHVHEFVFSLRKEAGNWDMCEHTRLPFLLV